MAAGETGPEAAAQRARHQNIHRRDKRAPAQEIEGHMNDQTLDPQVHIHELGTRARDASRALLGASTDAKNTALRAAAKALRDHASDIITANDKDVASVEGQKPESFIDRLRLTEDRIEGMAAALEEIAELPDPVGRKLATFDRPNGLTIDRVAVPIGVIGMIYESRPNVGADASALCLKSGNAVILRGGSESRHSTRVIVDCMQQGLEAAGLPRDAVQTVQTTDRAAVAALLKADEFVDLVIPRGGRGLVELVRDQASVPTLLHLDGNCHSYVHESADLAKAAEHHPQRQAAPYRRVRRDREHRDRPRRGRAISSPASPTSWPATANCAATKPPSPSTAASCPRPRPTGTPNIWTRSPR